MAEGMAFKAALKTIQTNQVYERIMFTQVKAKEAKGSKGTTKGEGKTRSGKCLSVRQDHMKLPSSGSKWLRPGSNPLPTDLAVAQSGS